MHIFVIGAALLLLGFAFPPAWLGLAAYVLYVAKTSKKRRAKIIEGYLFKMLEGSRKTSTFPALYFDAARAYAEQNGGKSYEEDCITCDALLNGRIHSVFFMRDRELGGTYISFNT